MLAGVSRGEADEVLLDYFVGENQFQSNEKLWRKYFYAFGYAARSTK